MIERGGGLRLTLKTIVEALVRGLQGDLAVQARVPRAIDLAHAALAKLRNDFIRAKARTGGERHTQVSLSAGTEVTLFTRVWRTLPSRVRSIRLRYPKASQLPAAAGR